MDGFEGEPKVTISRDRGSGRNNQPEAQTAPEADDGARDPGPAAFAVPDYREVGLAEGLPGLVELMDRLLAEDGCPWDREQTLDSLRPYLLEEAHEVLDAMETPAEHRKELGDLLFQIVFQSALRQREGAFDIQDVIAGIRTKMLRRHPHVFGPRDADGRPQLSAEDVEAQWERIKAAERGTTTAPNPLRGVPKTLPALGRAWRLQEKAAAVGFDWPDVEGALDKLREEWAEFVEAQAGGSLEQRRDEFGDLLFVMVRIGQKLGLDAEDALRRANAKFERRFAHVIECSHPAGIEPSAAGLDQLEAWWQDAKRGE